MTPRHPATYHPNVMRHIRRALKRHCRPRSVVVDPFAGVGTIHELREDGYLTYGCEIEPEWARANPLTSCADARRWLPRQGVRLRRPAPSPPAAIATSPAYGNRMADAYDGRDGSRRHTYRTALGRPLREGNGAGLQWGPAYRTLHEEVWQAAFDALRPGDFLMLNMKDHIRAGKRQFVTAWHVSTLKRIGFKYLYRDRIGTPGLRHGSNANIRLDWEVLVVFQKPEPRPEPVQLPPDSGSIYEYQYADYWEEGDDLPWGFPDSHITTISFHAAPDVERRCRAASWYPLARARGTGRCSLVEGHEGEHMFPNAGSARGS